ncbi:MAG TPA: STAS domain-containing protein [bacterium]|jgi:hypothetical protein
MPLELRRRRIGSGDKAVEIIDVNGRLDMPGAAALRTKVQDILKEHLPRIVLNMRECIEIHREMIGTFHSLGRACHRAGGGMIVCSAEGDVNEYILTFADRSLLAWYETEREAIIALGGEVEPLPEEPAEHEPLPVVACGNDQVFKVLFWKLNALGGHPVGKFDSVQGCMDFLARRDVHSIILDASMNPYDVTKLIHTIKSRIKTRKVGLFVVGAPSNASTGRALVLEGADHYVPITFNGEEIPAKIDGKKFFLRLKDIYERFDARNK